ncbi:SusC/RagA family TonB-linked outer membrane protein [Salegentibacter mishustinae]|uniref:SusC/RagA family TonB-linked outer membrane protein n=1 Tax=Salegentibacter mishustinae TaxID=270918 RepID=A0A0Q9ZC71_9FLAO|nr:TonB-dependent receptor [Salegentibacter mishustinae]KRG30677.1 SusC/RagA family TonB-linked outer membrane protein [Salegentibacter mishustinae]PNW23565.1 SusC/RagA family TonB-linked outer membrane protein [Salegentibacter mishustinae]PZX66647.1 TonB-linked SusC/RagA family outer membrane protein [Salegentibacter mishustinae]
MKLKLFSLCMVLLSGFGFAQEAKTISGVITDQNEMPLPGAEVKVTDKEIFDVTDFDGNFTLENVEEGDVVRVTFLGFLPQEFTVSQNNDYTITLKEDADQLDEVVVIGYGTQEKRDLTGSIASLNAEEIEKTPTANVMQSLQGKVSGVQIVNSGAPGDSPTVRIRGLGTFGEATNVLYVVDGTLYDNIDFLNTKDIKSVNVLKDASSSAIYGVRAANGVVIIETKSGRKNQKPQFEYDGYTGFQRAQNVVKLANTEQFATMARESGSAPETQFIENAIQRYGRSRINPNVPAVNTDWYKEILRQGLIQNHSISASGGGESIVYAVGANYTGQEGILDMKNNYERFNIRSKVEIDLTDRLKMGVNSIFSNATKYAPENGAWFRAYFAVPTMPVIDEMNTEAGPIRYSNAQLLGYRGTQNPFQDLTYNENRQKIRKQLTSAFLQYELIEDKLDIKTTYSHDYSSLELREVNLPYTLGNNFERRSSIKRENNNFSNQYWDNVLTYDDTFGDHDLTVMAGASFRDEASNRFEATGFDITGIGLETSWYLDFADPDSFANNVEEIGRRFYGLSYFGRVSYSFKDKYLLYGTFRADGSSKFTLDPWGYFPSVGLGWVVSEEEFLAENDVLDFFKLRASWGKLGNDNVAPSAGSNTIEVVTAPIGDQPRTGTTSTSVFSNNTWEVIEEYNFGLNLEAFKRRLSIDADYYIRDTQDAILPVYIPIVNRSVDRNSGVIRNEGLELVANWNQQVTEDFSFRIGANFTTLKNEALEIEDDRGYIDSGSAEFRQRTIEGGPLLGFYGYERVGVYQNEQEIAADPVAVENNLVPGDLIYRDQNGDGVIDDSDRVILGSFLPKYTFGGNIGVTYKAFDFSVDFYGQTGNKILNRKRGEIIFTQDTNMDADLAINRWHGEGTSNTYPSSAGLRKAWNQRLSDFWVEDGDFFRIQNIRLAYNIVADGLPETRIYFTAEKPFSFFSYNGFNPEVSDGVDRQTYPVPAIYTVGVNLKF